MIRPSAEQALLRSNDKLDGLSLHRIQMLLVEWNAEYRRVEDVASADHATVSNFVQIPCLCDAKSMHEKLLRLNIPEPRG